MIIRSQDKGSIRNFNLITDLVISKSNGSWEIIACYPYFAETDCGFSPIGRYSTEEKAIKVLDMIQIAYEEANSVFQMPKDEEV